jgi:hypothetical protein
VIDRGRALADREFPDPSKQYPTNNSAEQAGLALFLAFGVLLRQLRESLPLARHLYQRVTFFAFCECGIALGLKCCRAPSPEQN